MFTDELYVMFYTKIEDDNKMKITIGIPAYNEEKNIAMIIIKLKKITDSITSSVITCIFEFSCNEFLKRIAADCKPHG